MGSCFTATSDGENTQTGETYSEGMQQDTQSLPSPKDGPIDVTTTEYGITQFTQHLEILNRSGMIAKTTMQQIDTALRSVSESRRHSDNDGANNHTAIDHTVMTPTIATVATPSTHKRMAALITPYMANQALNLEFPVTDVCKRQ
eukprot:62324_1